MGRILQSVFGGLFAGSLVGMASALPASQQTPRADEQLQGQRLGKVKPAPKRTPTPLEKEQLEKFLKEMRELNRENNSVP